MYQLYKQFVHQEVAEFIPLIMNTITLQPTAAQRAHKDFNREVFVDFMGAQIKTLSFLAYIIRIYQEVVSTHSSLMVKGMLSLLSVCPHEVAHLRKELLIAARWVAYFCQLGHANCQPMLGNSLHNLDPLPLLQAYSGDRAPDQICPFDGKTL